MEIFFPQVHLRVPLTFELIPHDEGFRVVGPFKKVESKCCHDQNNIYYCEDSTNFCLVTGRPTHVEAVHRTKSVLMAHFGACPAPVVSLCELISN
jgi:hypothetical protein